MTWVFLDWSLLSCLTAAQEKAIAHSEYVTSILSKLYSIKYMRTFSNIGAVLNPNLYIVMMGDYVHEVRISPEDIKD